MAKRNIRKKDDPMLRKTSKYVKEVTKATVTLLDDMKETMYAAEGVGLAAVQVGVLRRIVIIDIGEKDEWGYGLLEMLNPELLESEGEQVSNEGCLSVPNYLAHVDRPANVKVKYYDREMNEKIIDAEGYLAIAICHEIDHLDGVLFTDKSYELEGDER